MAAYDEATLQRVVTDLLDPWDPAPVDLSSVSVRWDTQAVIVWMETCGAGTPTGLALDHMERFGPNAGRLVFTSWADTFSDSLDSNEWRLYVVDRYSYSWLEVRMELRYEEG